MSKLVCFSDNERISCDDVCPSNDYIIFLISFFLLIFFIMLATLFSKYIYRCGQFSSFMSSNNNINRLNVNGINKEIQCNIDCVRTLTINPDNSISILTDIDEEDMLENL